MNTGTTTKALSNRTKRARRNLSLKLALEVPFRRELIRYFNQLRKLAIKQYEKDRSILEPELYIGPTVNTLRKQYRRTAKAFSNEMRLFIGKSASVVTEKKQEGDDSRLAEDVAVANAVFIAQQSIVRSKPIVSTNDSDIKAAFTEARVQLSEQGIFEASAIAIIANKILKAKFNARINTITITETQFMSESSKILEASIIGEGEAPETGTGSPPQPAQGTLTSPPSGGAGKVDPVSLATSLGAGTVLFGEGKTKEWSAILDQVTRDAHAIADGQVVPMNEPFIVMGEQLMYPSDSSRGASMGNVLNCRCSALYI